MWMPVRINDVWVFYTWCVSPNRIRRWSFNQPRWTMMDQPLFIMKLHYESIIDRRHSLPVAITITRLIEILNHSCKTCLSTVSIFDRPSSLTISHRSPWLISQYPSLFINHYWWWAIRKWQLLRNMNNCTNHHKRSANLNVGSATTTDQKSSSILNHPLLTISNYS